MPKSFDERNHPRPNPLPEYRERGQARRVVVIGIVVFFVAIILVLSPLLLGRNMLNKYLVAFGLVGACAGVSLMLHGAVDWFRK